MSAPVPPIPTLTAEGSRRPSRGRPLRRARDRWLSGWLETFADLAELRGAHPTGDRPRLWCVRDTDPGGAAQRRLPTDVPEDESPIPAVEHR